MAMTVQDTKLKPGYKQTEVGVIPEDWKVNKLGNLGRVIRGASPRPQGDRRYYGGNIPRLMVEDVTRDGKYVTPKVDFLTEEGAKRSRPCKKGTLTIVCSGTVGIPSFLAVDACIHDGFLALIDINKYVSEDYLYHQLMMLRSKFEVSATHGGVFTNLTTSILNDFQIPLPSLPEQQAIASALSDIDALITSLDKLIAKKRDIKQATMQQLLTGKTRLPGFSGEWEVRRLGEIAEISMGRTPSRRNQAHWGRGYKWLSIADLKSKYLYETKEEITALAASDMAVIPKGTLVMSFKLTLGKLAFTGCEMYSNEAICSFIKLQANAEYLYYILGQTDFSLYGKQAVKGYTLNTDSLNSVEIPYPPLLEQQAIAKVLSDMDIEIVALEQKRDKTRALKQGMMQELLSGKTRLL